MVTDRRQPVAGHSFRWIAVLCLVGLIRCAQAGGGDGLAPIDPRSLSGGHTIVGRIVGVHDGDTVTLLDAEHHRHKVRLDGVDAPELGQPFGGASKKHLARLLFNREAVAECGKTDRYGREVCRVLVGGTDACLEQLQAGMAWYFRRYAEELRPDRREQYAGAEAQARAARRGLWADAEPMPPWDWRQRKGMGRVSATDGQLPARAAAASAIRVAPDPPR